MLQIPHGLSYKYIMAWVANISWLELQIPHDLSYKYLMTWVTNSSWLVLQISHDLSYKYLMTWVTNISWLELQISHDLCYKYLMTWVTNISWLVLQLPRNLFTENLYNNQELQPYFSKSLCHYNFTIKQSPKTTLYKVKSSFKYRLCSNSLGQHFLLLQAEYYLLLGFNQCKISSLKTQ